jgi:hypothetical protein
MSTQTTLTAQTADGNPLNTKTLKGVKGVWCALVSLFAALIIALSAVTGAGLGATKIQEAHALDISKWVMCDAFGKDSFPAKLYQYSQSNDLQFLAFSKSAATSGRSTPESGANMLLKTVGIDLEKNNQQLVIGGQSATEGAGFNKGAKLNFFDRFGLGGYTWTAYTGEWNYLVIDACSSNPEPKDPKANHYYDTRLDPTTTWDRVSSSQDPRVKIYANGQGARYSSALGTYVGNMFLGATTWVVGIFLALLILSFKDIGQLIGLSNITVGSKLGEPGGLLEYFTFNIFIPFGFLVFLTAVAINIYPLIRHKGTSVHKKRIAVSTITAILAVPLIWQATFLLPLPNRVAGFIQSVTIKTTAQELSNDGEWCTTEVGNKKNTYSAEKEGKNPIEATEDEIAQLVSENYGNIVASQLSCHFTKLFVFDPWVLGQFGTTPNNLWAEGKPVPEWAKDGKTIGNHNTKWVGDANVPMGGDTTLNNWALYQLSTQTTGHLPTGSETSGKAREAQGVSTDWWRVVDAFSNYDEKDVDIKVPPAREVTGNVSNGEWARPAEAAMTSPFGNRPEIGDTHKGIDFGAQCGAPIYAAGNGKVVFAQKATDGANGVIIQHDGVATMYWHLQDGSLKVSVGDEVKAGQQIGSSGDTGHAYGCHLHFEVRPGTDWGNQENVTDPQPWLNERHIDPTKAGDGLSPHAAATAATNSSSAVEITRGTQDMDAKPLQPWNTWVGASSGTRAGVGISAFVVSIVALTVPTLFALFTIVLTLILQLYILALPFILLILLSGTDKGINIAKKFGINGLWLFLARVIFGLLEVMAVVFVIFSYQIMESVGWWQGIFVLALLSVALWVMKDRIFALLKTYGGDFATKPLQAIANVTNTAKRLTGIGTATVIGGVTAKQAGHSFLAGAKNAGGDKARDALNKSKLGRTTLRTVSKSATLVPKKLLKSTGHTDSINEPTYVTCSSCGRTYKHGEIFMWFDQYDERMYCQNCKAQGLVPRSDMLVPIKHQEDKKKAKPRAKPAEDTYMKLALQQPETQRANVVDEASAYRAYDTLTSAAADSMARHFRTAFDDNQKTVVSYEIPEVFKPYFNVEAFNIARDNDDIEKMRRHWALAIHNYMEKELGYKINRTPEETLEDISRTIDVYSPWWRLDPNAKRGGQNDN